MHGKVVRRVIAGIDMQQKIPERKENSIICVRGKNVSGMDAAVQLPREVLTQGVGVIGETGSGKTYCIKRMVEDLRSNIGTDYSMIVIQAKNDFENYMRDEDYKLEQGVNSAGSIRWNIFRDILKDGYEDHIVELNTREFVAHLFEDKKDQKEQFFVDGARELLYCIIISYIRAAEGSLQAREKLSNKGLRDFFLQYTSENYKELLVNCGEPGVLKMILGEQTDNLQALGVWGELVTTVLYSMTDIFAEEGDFSIREFVSQKQGRTLFINYDPAYKDSQIKLFGAVVKLVLKEALAQNARGGNTILVCDELAAMGKTDIAEAVNLGRAKGLITILGIQSIAQLYSIYGEYDGQKLLAGLCTKLYFRPNDSLTRQYLMDDFGKVIAEYMFLSPGGTCSERREGYAIEDEDVIKMKVGDCYVKSVGGEMFKFHVC